MTIDLLPWQDLLFSVPTGIITVLTMITAVLSYKVTRQQHEIQTKSLEFGEVNKRLSALDRVLSLRVLKVGAIVADPWFIYSEGNPIPGGIYPAIFADIAQRHRLTIVYTQIRNSVIFERLDEQEIDLATQLLQTPGRAQLGEYAALIHSVKLVAVARKGQAKVLCVADLSNTTVRCAVVRGEIGAEVAMRQFKMSEENDRLVVLDTKYVPAIFYLIRDSIDIAITTGARWIEFQRKDPQFASQLEIACGGAPLQLVPAGCLVKKGELEFRDWLEREMEVSRRMPEVKKIEDTYLEQFSDAVDRI